MHLITMAHLGEAQGVIELFNLKRSAAQLFESDELNCLITGEGPFEAATSTATLLGQKKFSSVINLGIAGALSSEFKIGEIFPVRSVYLVIEGRPQFKTFKSADQGLDCLTSFERILRPEKAIPLSGIGHLVDREAWGVAMAAKNSSVPFSSHKLISDFAGSLGACELSREMALDWSQKLALYLHQLLERKSALTPVMRDYPGFHFTFSTRHQFEQMLQKIALRDELTEEEVLASLPFEQLRLEVQNSKDRTRLLLEQMESTLDPLKQRLKSGIEAFKKPLEKLGFILQHDPTWENAELKISFGVTSNEELKKKLELLTALDLRPFQDLRSGDFHVE